MFPYVFEQLPLAQRNDGHSKIFVAHSYHDQRKADLRSTVRRAFEPELTPYYADAELDPNHLLVKLARRIETSRFFICDLSQNNPNVMIELGIAFGRNKKILLCGNINSDFPKFFWKFGGARYRDYKQLGEELEQHKYEMMETIIASPSSDWCQLCRQHCSGRATTTTELPDRVFIVDDTPQFQSDFFMSAKQTIEPFGLKPITMKDAEQFQIQILCGYVSALRMSRLAFFRFTKSMSPLVPFLFGLSYGLEIYPVLVAEKDANAIPTDLAGLDRIDYESFEDLTLHFSEKLPSYLDKAQKMVLPAEWNKLDAKAREALSQIQTFLSLPAIPKQDKNGNNDEAENKLQIGLALGLYAIKCSAGSLMVVTPDKKLRIKALVAPTVEMDAVGEWREFDINEGICGWVVRETKPFLTGDRNVEADGVIYARRSFDKNLVALAAVPIIYNDKVVGVINADSREQDFFREADLEVLAMVANMLAPIVAQEAQQLQEDKFTSPPTYVEAELQKGHVCMNCGESSVLLGFKRLDDQDGLRYRMYLRCTNCNQSDDIRSYILRST